MTNLYLKIENGQTKNHPAVKDNRYVLALHTEAVAALMEEEEALRLIVILMPVVVAAVQSVSSGPVTLAHSHQPVLSIFNQR